MKQYIVKTTTSFLVGANDKDEVRECLAKAKLVCTGSVIDFIAINSIIEKEPGKEHDEQDDEQHEHREEE